MSDVTSRRLYFRRDPKLLIFISLWRDDEPIPQEFSFDGGVAVLERWAESYLIYRDKESL